MEFVEQKRKEILTGGAATANAYTSRLRTLNGGVTPTTDYYFLEDINHIMSFLEKNYKPNTQRNFIIAIVSTLKKISGKHQLYEEYSKIMDQMNSDLRINNTRSQVQQENWISQDEVKEVYTNLYRQVHPILFSKSSPSISDWEQIIHLVTLALYTQQPPRRLNDYLFMVIVRKLPKQMNMSTNYFDLTSKTFYFNNFKTSGTYSTQSVKCSDELFALLTQYIKKHPLKLLAGSQIPLLCTMDGNPLPRANVITRILNKVFGKQISVSMLRSIYITDKFAPQQQSMEQTATDMGTSVGTMQNNYIKRDT